MRAGGLPGAKRGRARRCSPRPRAIPRRPARHRGVAPLLALPAPCPPRTPPTPAPALVEGLIERWKKEPEAARRREYADLLTRVCKKPGPWTYWGFRPPPRPANTVTWERIEAIAQVLDRALAGADRAGRLDLLRRKLRGQVPASGPALARRPAEARHPGTPAVPAP